MGAITLALALASVGCFSEPPSSGSGGSSSSETGSSGTGATGEPTSTSGTGSSSGSGSGSAETIDPDTGGSSSTGQDPECNIDDVVETGRVPADVVVIVTGQSSVPEGFLKSFDMTTNVAVIASEAVAAALADDVLQECWNGCGGCLLPNRVLLPYAVAALGGAFDAFLGGDYECVFRGPPPGVSASAPSRQLWLFTESPSLPVPDEVELRIRAEGLRLHVACPGCDEAGEELENTDLGRLVMETQGSFANSDEGLAGQRQTVTAARTSCVWAEEDPPVLFFIDNGFAPRGEPFLAWNAEDAGFGDCEETFEKDGEELLFPLFFPNEDGTVELCPIACRLAQLTDADSTDLYRCD